MSRWTLRQVPFKYQLSDWTLMSLSLRLQTTSIPLGASSPAPEPAAPDHALEQGSQGFFVHAMPLAPGQPVFSRRGEFLCYIPLQYNHYYIDMEQDFEAYKARFSSKTRSTIARKLKRWAEHSGGSIRWKAYRTAEEMDDFFAMARSVSAQTYQERLLEAGLPNTTAFLAQMKQRAELDLARGFILFDADKAVSYLYCPVDDGVLIYAYLGYDPQYRKLSVGTVLQWLALESLFNEGQFRCFDFTEGQSEHKRLFATHSVPSANVIFARPTLFNRFVLLTHKGFAQFSSWLGATLDQWGLKSRIKQVLRFGG